MTLAAFFVGLAGEKYDRPEHNWDMPSLSGATQWLNSKPLTEMELHGKVVLVEFWTYTCVNWRRTLPYVRAWSKKYSGQGLTVIGIHTPEFSFERNENNVRWALQDMNIDFPVAMDNNHEIWQAFQNQYWPAMYFVDARGRIRHQQFGEGNYDQSEKVIQQLLAETGEKDIDTRLTPIETTGAEVAADWSTLASPENYLSHEWTSGFSSPGGAKASHSRNYTIPSRLRLNQWAHSGNWTMNRESNVSNEDSGRIVYRFHARDVNLIMGPHIPGTTLKFRVLIDGKTPDKSHGVDTDENGNGLIKEQRMYQLIRQPGPITDRELEIEFPDKGVEVFDFTFG